MWLLLGPRQVGESSLLTHCGPERQRDAPGGLTKLWPVNDPDARDPYLSSYTQTYIERDVRALMQVDQRREFERFLRLCALRTGCLVNLDDWARDSGVSAATVSGWGRVGVGRAGYFSSLKAWVH